MDADLLSLSAHKFGGPPGVGVLVVRGALALQPLTPGHQEAGRRGGTHNVPYVEALALALELAQAEQPAHAARVERLRDTLRARGARAHPGVTRERRRARPGCPTPATCTSRARTARRCSSHWTWRASASPSGAACASGSLTPSHVLRAQGLSEAQARASLRFSLGPEASEDEVARVVAALSTHVPAARAP